MFSHDVGRFLLAVASLLPGCAWCDASISLHFYERPPFMHNEGERAVGLTADVAGQAFERAAIPYVWALTPARRQLLLIEQNRGRDCAIGWFRTPERAAKGKFSQAIYVDLPPVGLVRSDFQLPPGGLARILAGGELHAVVKQGLTYGDYIAGRRKPAHLLQRQCDRCRDATSKSGHCRPAALEGGADRQGPC